MEADNGAECLWDSKDFFQAGCAAKFTDMVEQNSSVIIGAGVTIGLLQILGVVFSIMLICKIRGQLNYEPQYNNYT